MNLTYVVHREIVPHGVSGDEDGGLVDEHTAPEILTSQRPAYLQCKVTCRKYFYRAPVGVHNVLRLLQHQQLVRRPLVQRQNVGLSAMKLFLFIAVVRNLVRVNQPADILHRRLSRPVRRGRVLSHGRAARPHRRSCRGACLLKSPAASLGWRHLSALGPSAPRAGPGARHSFFVRLPSAHELNSCWICPCAKDVSFAKDVQERFSYNVLHISESAMRVRCSSALSDEYRTLANRLGAVTSDTLLILSITGCVWQM